MNQGTAYPDQGLELTPVSKPTPSKRGIDYFFRSGSDMDHRKRANQRLCINKHRHTDAEIFYEVLVQRTLVGCSRSMVAIRSSNLFAQKRLYGETGNGIKCDCIAPMKSGELRCIWEIGNECVKGCAPQASAAVSSVPGKRRLNRPRKTEALRGNLLAQLNDGWTISLASSTWFRQFIEPLSVWRGGDETSAIYAWGWWHYYRLGARRNVCGPRKQVSFREQILRHTKCACFRANDT